MKHCAGNAAARRSQRARIPTFKAAGSPPNVTQQQLDEGNSMTNTAENHSVLSHQTTGSKQALTARQQQVSSAQLLAEQQLPQSHATAAAERTALAAIENVASTGQPQPSLTASGTNAAGAIAADAIVGLASTTSANNSAATLAACTAAASTTGRAAVNDAAVISNGGLVPAAFAAAMPAAPPLINTNRVTSAPAASGLHSSSPMTNPAASSARAASTAAGTAAPAAGTALVVVGTAAPTAGTALVVAGTAAPATSAAVRAIARAAPVASRSIPAADRAAPATNTQPVFAGTAELLAQLPTSLAEVLHGLLGNLSSIINCSDISELQSIIKTLLSKVVQQDEELSSKVKALQKLQAETTKLVNLLFSQDAA